MEVTDDHIKKRGLLEWGIEKMEDLTSKIAPKVAKAGEVIDPVVDKAKSAASSMASKAKEGKIVDAEVLSEKTVKEAA